MDESLLLTSKVIEFRNTYPQLIAQWKKQIGHGDCHADLHFCLNLVDGFPKLDAYLCILEYRTGFAINAHIIHSNWQRVFIESGHNYHIARELANHEIRLTYKALNESEAIAEDPKVQLYHDILTDDRSSNY